MERHSVETLVSQLQLPVHYWEELGRGGARKSMRRRLVLITVRNLVWFQRNVWFQLTDA